MVLDTRWTLNVYPNMLYKNKINHLLCKSFLLLSIDRKTSTGDAELNEEQQEKNEHVLIKIVKDNYFQIFLNGGVVVRASAQYVDGLWFDPSRSPIFSSRSLGSTSHHLPTSIIQILRTIITSIPEIFQSRTYFGQVKLWNIFKD